MQISMKLSDTPPNAYDIEAKFQSGASLKLTVSELGRAIFIYKTILFAYESGQLDDVNFNIARIAEQSEEDARRQS